MVLHGFATRNLKNTLELSKKYIAFDNFNMFFRFLAEIRFRTIMKLLQDQETTTRSFGTSITLSEVTVWKNHIEPKRGKWMIRNMFPGLSGSEMSLFVKV